MAGNGNIQRASELLQQAASILQAMGQAGSPARASVLPESSNQQSARPETPRAPIIQHRSNVPRHEPYSTPRSTNSPSLERPNIPNALSSPAVASTSTSSGGRTPNLALTELRGLFSPQFPSRSGRSGRSGISGAGRRSWEQKFFCLGGPDESRTPSNVSRALLTNAGLGNNIITLNQCMKSIEIENLLRATYTQLQLAPGIELMVASGPGRAALLMRLSSAETIPCAAVIYSSGRKETIIYIRPSTVVLEERESQGVALGEPDQDDFVDIIPCVASGSSVPNLSTSAEGLETAGPLDRNLNNRQEIPLSLPGSSNVTQYENFDFETELTIDDLRRRLYKENPGTQPLFVCRDNYEMQVLGVYKHPSFRIFAEPDVTFIGEFGADAGALMREFFWTSFRALEVGKFMNRTGIFEGESDHKIPNSDATLLWNNVFPLIGKFMVHACLHSGIAFIGLSKSVVSYILAESPCLDSGIELTLEDVADIEVRDALIALENWDTRSPLTDDQKQLITKAAVQSEITSSIVPETRLLMYDQILYHYVIQKRKAQLDAIREQFAVSPLLKYLQDRAYLCDSVFPRNGDLEVPYDVILRKIALENPTPENQAVFQLLMRVLTETLTAEPALTTELLKAWTAWPLLPEKTLKVAVGNEFCIHACSHELVIPVTASYDMLQCYIMDLLKTGTVGFTTI